MLLRRYGSLESMLRQLRGQFPWEISKFVSIKRRASRGYWKDLNKQREFIENVGKQLKIVRVRDKFAFGVLMFLSSFQIGMEFRDSSSSHLADAR